MNEELKEKLTETFPAAEISEGQFLNMLLPADNFPSVFRILKTEKDFHFDYLFCLTCVDQKDHLQMFYHLHSFETGNELVLKTNLPKENPEIPTAGKTWKTALMHECEVFDLFGVKFNGHPSLKRIFLGEDWKGFPLRKDYMDDLNMIGL